MTQDQMEELEQKVDTFLNGEYTDTEDGPEETPFRHICDLAAVDPEETIASRVKKILADPARRRMDYHNQCLEESRQECTKLEELKELRDRYEEEFPRQAKKQPGPDCNYYRSLPSFCQACILEQKQERGLLSRFRRRSHE